MDTYIEQRVSAIEDYLTSIPVDTLTHISNGFKTLSEDYTDNQNISIFMCSNIDRRINSGYIKEAKHILQLFRPHDDFLKEYQGTHFIQTPNANSGSWWNLLPMTINDLRLLVKTKAKLLLFIVNHIDEHIKTRI